MKRLATMFALVLVVTVSSNTSNAGFIFQTGQPPVQNRTIENQGIVPDIDLGGLFDEKQDPTDPPAKQPKPATGPARQPNLGDLFGLPDGHPGFGAPKLRPEDYEVEFLMIWSNMIQEYQDAEKLKPAMDIQRKYKGKIRNQEQLDAALTELAKSVNDRWTHYQSGASIIALAKEMKDGKRSPGMFLIGDGKGGFKVDFIMINSPAYNSRLRRGDVVTKVNGESLKGLTDEQAENKLLTKSGESFKVTYLEDGKEVEETITMTPRKADQLDVRMMNGNIAYVRIPSLEDDLTSEIMLSLLMLEETSGKKVQGLLLDLRSNPGGSVQATINLASLFAGAGPVSHVTLRKGMTLQKTTYEVQDMPKFMNKDLPAEAKEFMDLLKKKPMVILVDGCTMSAAELFTGALKDNGRARVVGTTTFGKGQVLLEEEVLGGGSFTITSGKYFTPKGTDVTSVGIKPHVTVEHPRGSADDAQLKAALAEVKNLIDGKVKTTDGEENTSTSTAHPQSSVCNCAKAGDCTPSARAQEASTGGVSAGHVVAFSLLALAFVAVMVVRYRTRTRNRNRDANG